MEFFNPHQGLIRLLPSAELQIPCHQDPCLQFSWRAFDLPFAAKEKISLTSTEDSVSVEAKMRKPITMQMGGHLQKRVEFEKYTNKIRLPVKVDPRRARAKFRNGHLVVRFPIARRGNIVKVR